MCNNIIVLWIFIILKIISIIILPIIIIIKRKKDYIKYILIADLILLVFFAICNIFNINKCVYNSSISGINRVNNENRIVYYNNLHPNVDNTGSYNTNPELNYKTYKGQDLYYFNQNRNYLKDNYYECINNKIYLNSNGSSITAFSIAISTLYNKTINPIEILNYYKDDNNMCDKEITIESIYDSFIQRYGNISLNKIGSSQIADEIRNGGIVIAKLKANENSKLTCDTGYIVIYNINLNDKFQIADPASLDEPYVCPYSSRAYGQVISNDNMDKPWSLGEIQSEAVEYYVVKKR